jgi:hypothetical protein
MKDFNFSSLGSSGEGGEFSPYSFLLYFSFPESRLYESQSLEAIRANRILCHEYQHFLQFTTTTFGLNVFLLEFDRAVFTLLCIKELLKVVSRVEFPLLVWRNQTNNKKVKEIIDAHHKIVLRREEGLGVLFGDCDFDDSSETFLYNGQKVTAPNVTCPFVQYSPSKKPVALGARAIMEGGASLVEAAYLFSKIRLGSSKEIIEYELNNWRTAYKADPRYYLTINLAEGLDPYTLLILSDLALFTPPEIDYFADPFERSPGHRFMKGLRESKKLPQLNSLNSHSAYREYVGELCWRLGWQTPWELITEKLLDFVTDEIPFNLINAFGIATTFLRGLSLRKKEPSYCANPIPDFTREEAQKFGRTNDQSKSTLLYTNFIQLAHPIPFIVANGERAYNIEKLAELDPSDIFKNIDNDLYAKELMEFKKNPMSKDEYGTHLRTSFDEFFIGQRLVNLLWNGPTIINQKPCLKLDGIISPLCKGGIVSGDYRHDDECLCKNVLEEFLPCSLSEISWIAI